MLSADGCCAAQGSGAGFLGTDEPQSKLPRFVELLKFKVTSFTWFDFQQHPHAIYLAMPAQHAWLGGA